MAKYKPGKVDDSGGLSKARLAATAAQIRKLFVACFRNAKLHREGVASDWGARHMPKWDGGDGDTASYEPIWPKVARVCLEGQMDPGAFVSSQFDRTGKGSERIPLPNILLGERAVDRYQTHQAGAVERLRRALNVQMIAFSEETKSREHERNLSTTAAAETVLRDRTFDLSGIFRYCLAVKGKAPVAAEKFFDSAVQEYVFQRRAYDAAWGDLIPDALKTAAAAFFAK